MRTRSTGNDIKINSVNFFESTDILSARTLNRPLISLYENDRDNFELLQSMAKTIVGSKEGIKYLAGTLEDFNINNLVVEEYNNKKYLRIPTGLLIFCRNTEAEYTLKLVVPQVDTFERQIAKCIGLDLNEANNDIEVSYKLVNDENDGKKLQYSCKITSLKRIKENSTETERFDTVVEDFDYVFEGNDEDEYLSKTKRENIPNTPLGLVKLIKDNFNETKTKAINIEAKEINDNGNILVENLTATPSKFYINVDFDFTNYIDVTNKSGNFYVYYDFTENKFKIASQRPSSPIFSFTMDSYGALSNKKLEIESLDNSTLELDNLIVNNKLEAYNKIILKDGKTNPSNSIEINDGKTTITGVIDIQSKDKSKKININNSEILLTGSTKVEGNTIINGETTTNTIIVNGETKTNTIVVNNVQWGIVGDNGLDGYIN